MKCGYWTTVIPMSSTNFRFCVCFSRCGPDFKLAANANGMRASHYRHDCRQSKSGTQNHDSGISRAIRGLDERCLCRDEKETGASPGAAAASLHHGPKRLCYRLEFGATFHNCASALAASERALFSASIGDCIPAAPARCTIGVRCRDTLPVRPTSYMLRTADSKARCRSCAGGRAFAMFLLGIMFLLAIERLNFLGFQHSKAGVTPATIQRCPQRFGLYFLPHIGMAST